MRCPDPPLPAFAPRQTFSACVFACLAQLFGLVCTSACKTAWRASRGRIRGQLKVSELRRASPKGSCSADGYKQDLRKCCAAHGRPSGLTRITHAALPPGAPLLLFLHSLTWQSLPCNHNGDSDLFKNIFHSRQIEYRRSGARAKASSSSSASDRCT